MKTSILPPLFSGSGVREVEAMAGETSDVELMLKVKQGDREALSALIQRYRKPLINFIYRFTTKYQDLSIKEMPEILKCSGTTVKSLIFWAYRTLCEKLISMIEARA
jgi:DNA-directed RNA polymerase specialized sigma24 family protein